MYAEANIIFDYLNDPFEEQYLAQIPLHTYINVTLHLPVCVIFVCLKYDKLLNDYEINKRYTNTLEEALMNKEDISKNSQRAPESLSTVKEVTDKEKLNVRMKPQVCDHVCIYVPYNGLF